ncbi:MAG TPA: T9SS type A sorting domain-containing protein [Chitinophagaceae bacterium]
MKTIITLIQSKNLLIGTLLLLSVTTGFSQPDYAFSGSTLISGTARQVGAKYRFSNIKPGIDGIITIKDLNKITLTTFDATGNGGFTEAFQPEIAVPRKTKGYVEFQLDFVLTGTTTPTIQTEVPATAIDIDGYVYPDEKVYEFDEFQNSPSFYIRYDLMGTSLDVKQNSNWVTAINTTATDYPGVDTVQKNVMISMVHAGVSTIIFRVGAENKSNTNTTRLRSVYFKRFAFPGVPLSQSPLMSFTGKKDKNNINLNWKFSSIDGMKECMIERSADGKGFLTISSNILNENGEILAYNYTDVIAGNGTYTYRLKMTDANGKSVYSQNLLFKQSGTSTTGTMNIYPNVIQNRASVQVNSEASAKTELQIVDYSGRVMYKQSVMLMAGTNSINLEVPANISRGNYIVVLPLHDKIVNQKIIIQ